MKTPVVFFPSLTLYYKSVHHFKSVHHILKNGLLALKVVLPHFFVAYMLFFTHAFTSTHTRLTRAKTLLEKL